MRKAGISPTPLFQRGVVYPLPFEEGGQEGHLSARLFYTLILALVFILTPAYAQVANNAAPLQFRNTAEQHRFNALAAELRCVMCQNQALADSDAQIARDLRAEVLALMHQGHSDTEIKQFLIQRYGEFVLYRPRVAADTWLLWFGPLLLVLGGGLVIARIVRSRAQAASATDAAREQSTHEQEW